VITLQDIFEFKIERVTPERVVIGELGATGLRPTFLYKFEKHGISLPVDLFVKKKTPEHMPEFQKATAS
jgi:pilus assembly protein CpaF